MHHLYLSYQPDDCALSAERAQLLSWCERSGVKEYCDLCEKITQGRVTRKLMERLYGQVKAGDTVVCSSLPRMGRSLKMVVMALGMCCERGVTVVSVEDGRVYAPDHVTRELVQQLDYAVTLETAIHAQRADEATFRMRQNGSVLGRPVGSKRRPEKNVLFGKEEELVRLRTLGWNPRQISQALGVSRTTVDNYLKTKGIV